MSTSPEQLSQLTDTISKEWNVYMTRISKSDLPAIATIQTGHLQDGVINWEETFESKLEWDDTANLYEEPGILDGDGYPYCGFEPSTGVYRTYDNPLGRLESTRQMRILYKDGATPLHTKETPEIVIDSDELTSEDIKAWFEKQQSGTIQTLLQELNQKYKYVTVKEIEEWCQHPNKGGKSLKDLRQKVQELGLDLHSKPSRKDMKDALLKMISGDAEPTVEEIEEWCQHPNKGGKSLKELRQKVQELGLDLGTKPSRGEMKLALFDAYGFVCDELTEELNLLANKLNKLGECGMMESYWVDELPEKYRLKMDDINKDLWVFPPQVYDEIVKLSDFSDEFERFYEFEGNAVTGSGCDTWGVYRAYMLREMRSVHKEFAFTKKDVIGWCKLPKNGGLHISKLKEKVHGIDLEKRIDIKKYLLEIV